MATPPSKKKDTYQYYYDGKDGTVVRLTPPMFKEIMLPDGTWSPYQADLIHDYVPVDPADVQGLLDRVQGISSDSLQTD